MSYITADGVVLDWSQVALCFVLVLALSAFLTEGIEMISRTVSRRRHRQGRPPSKPRRHLVGPTTKYAQLQASSRPHRAGRPARGTAASGKKIATPRRFAGKIVRAERGRRGELDFTPASSISADRAEGHRGQSIPSPDWPATVPQTVGFIA